MAVFCVLGCQALTANEQCVTSDQLSNLSVTECTGDTTEYSGISQDSTQISDQVCSWLKYKIIYSTPCNSFLLLLPTYKLYRQGNIIVLARNAGL